MSDFRLRVFQSVAKNLSFTKASQELFISQPAISKHIQELEAAYGSPLFERFGNKITLTAAGQLLLKHSDIILEKYRNLEYEMHCLNNKVVSALRLGASTTITQYVLPPLLAMFSDKYPDIKVSLLNGNSQDIEKLLHNKQIDLGLVEGTSKLSSLKYSEFLQDELVAVTRSNGKYSHKDEISLEELKHIPTVLREHGSGTLDVIIKALSEHGTRLSDLNIKMFLGSTESIKRFIQQTDCIGIVSIRSIQDELKSQKLQVIEIEDMKMIRRFSFIKMQGDDNPVSQLFINFSLKNNKLL